MLVSNQSQAGFLIGKWVETDKYSVSLFQSPSNKTGEEELTGCLIDKEMTHHFSAYQIKCGINEDMTHMDMINRIDSYAKEKITDYIAVYAVFLNNKVDGLWVFEAHKWAAGYINQAKKNLKLIDFNKKDWVVLFSEAVKRFECALKLQAKQGGDTKELTSVITQLKNNPLWGTNALSNTNLEKIEEPTSINKTHITTKNLPLEAELLNKISNDTLEIYIKECIKILIHSSPIKSLEGKQCFILIEEGAHWQKETCYASNPWSWFLKFLRPALQQLSLEVPIIDYDNTKYNHLSKAVTADLTIIFPIAEIDDLLKTPNNIKSDLDHFLALGLCYLETRQFESNLLADSYKIGMEKNLTTPLFCGYQNVLLENTPEGQYTILFKLVAKICKSSDEMLQQTIERFRVRCRDSGTPNTNSSLTSSTTSSFTKELSAFEKMEQEVKQAEEIEKEKMSVVSDDLINEISKAIQVRLRDRSLSRTFYVRYDKNEIKFGSNSPYIKLIIKRLMQNPRIRAWDHPEIEEERKDVYEVLNSYYGKEWGTKIIEHKHPAIQINILD